jgi:hypothetical protein
LAPAAAGEAVAAAIVTAKPTTREIEAILERTLSPPLRGQAGRIAA